MSYKLIYTMPYASLNNEACVVEIEKEDYTGLPTVLTGSESPFEVEIDDNDFLYAPTRFSTARIRVVGSDYLQELYSTSYQQYRVTFKRDGVVTWCGFVKPEVYTQDYSSDKFELEIECMSAMSVLEFINYKQVGDGTRVFVSFWDLFRKCIESAKGQYSAIYIPHVYAKDAASYTSGLNVFTDMSVSEQNFFDEDDKPMKLKEVLEEMCKFLNWTCVDYLGELYFVDMDHDGEYYRYNPDMTVFSKVDRVPILNVQKVGFAGNDHALDFLPGYNKCVVRTSNYPVGTLLPDESFDELKPIKTIDDIKGDNKQVCRSVYLIPCNWNTNLYDTKGVIIPIDKLPDYSDVIPSLQGASLMRLCVYNQKEVNGKWIPDITEYSFTNAVRVRFVDDPNDPEAPIAYVKVMQFKGATATFSNGAIGVSGSVKTIKDSSMLPWGDSSTTSDFELACKIKIGNKYYGSANGFNESNKPFSWSDNPKSFVKLLLNPDHVNRPKDWINIDNKKTLSMPYSGLSGMIIPINEPISGSFEFTLYAENKKKVGYYINEGLYLKDFKVMYKKEDGAQKEDDNSDRYYENIVNEDYINELDEIEFKISSYNNDGACYSKVLIEGKYLTDNLYSSVMGEPTRPEEQLIHRIINRYSATHVKLTQVIKETPKLTPLTKLSDNFMVDKKFAPIGGSIDYKTGQYRCIMVDV